MTWLDAMWARRKGICRIFAVASSIISMIESRPKFLEWLSNRSPLVQYQRHFPRGPLGPPLPPSNPFVSRMPSRSFYSIRVRGIVVANGPLVVPSYSSKALVNVSVSQTLTKTLEFVAGPILVSAYDIEHWGVAIEGVESPFIIVDSGGYETLVDEEGRKRGGNTDHAAFDWDADAHRRALNRISTTRPVLAVSYDRVHLSLDEQIDAAIDAQVPRFGSCFLIKPTSDGPTIIEPLRIETIARLAHRFDAFDVVGVTEKEIGSTFLERLVFVARLRALMDERDVRKPIHVFGGLDPFMTPLYLLAGADIVDGLTWLRMAFAPDGARYLPSQAASSQPSVPLAEVEWEIRRRNFGRAVDIQTGVRRFLRSGDYMQLTDDPQLSSIIQAIHSELLSTLAEISPDVQTFAEV